LKPDVLKPGVLRPNVLKTEPFVNRTFCKADVLKPMDLKTGRFGRFETGHYAGVPHRIQKKGMGK
jgi:hypothetical protein